MSKRSSYTPAPAYGAHIEKDGEQWTLVLVRDLKHPPEKVWRALTEPEHLEGAGERALLDLVAMLPDAVVVSPRGR